LNQVSEDSKLGISKLGPSGKLYAMGRKKEKEKKN
jgi:hypothetical protein